MENADVVIVGAGQAGLAAAHAASQAGLRPVVLEAGPEPVGSWPRYYDSLTLFSPARYSQLPGRPFGGDPDRYPTRDELIDYLRGYADGLDAELRCGEGVEAVTALPAGGFEIRTTAGPTLTSTRLIAASGGFGSPHRPALPGLDRFAGTVLHSSEYRRPQPFAGRRVVVVGGGNSAMQIAAELADVARVTMTTRGPLRFLPQRPLGRDLHWWLKVTGLDTSRLGRRLLDGPIAILDDGRYRAALAAGKLDHRPMPSHFDGERVVWSDGPAEPVDAVLLATGYRPELRYLRDTGALAEDGAPLHRSGVSTTLPGLGYVGLPFQRSFASATVRGVGADAAYLVARLARRAADESPASPPLHTLRRRTA